MSNNNRNRRQPQDHRPKGGQARREAQGDLYAAVTWRGREWTINLERGHVPVAIMEAFEDGKTVTALRALLGAQQWSAFMAYEPDMTDLETLFDAMAKELGFTDPGESPASAR